jgi:Na+/phosphate symporter
LTTLQQGMGGLAEQLHPADLPAIFGPGVSWWSSLLGTLALIVVGLAVTAVMQSSTAAVTVTLSAQFAGAIGIDQACALIIWQNIGTATSSALAAIGALPGQAHHAAAGDEHAMVALEDCARRLGELQQAHRKLTLGAVATGAASADEAIASVDMFRWLATLARHAWRSAAYLTYQPPMP